MYANDDLRRLIISLTYRISSLVQLLECRHARNRQGSKIACFFFFIQKIILRPCLDIDQAMEDYLNPDQPIAWLALILFPDRDVISAFLAGSKNS